MYKIDYDITQLTHNLTAIEKRHVPSALLNALNSTAFQIKDRWKDRIGEVFHEPVPLTRNAVLYRRAKPMTLINDMVADVFLKGAEPPGIPGFDIDNPPGKYLMPQEHGGARSQKGFERKLQQHPRARKFYVPGQRVQLDPFGNLPRGLYNKIFAQLRVAEDVSGFSGNETASGRARRLNRQRRRGGGGSYFILAQRRGKLRPGVIYERINDLSISDAGDARATSKVRAVLYPVDHAPTYRPRFNAVNIGRGIARTRLPKNFRFYLHQALATR